MDFVCHINSANSAVGDEFNIKVFQWITQKLQTRAPVTSPVQRLASVVFAFAALSVLISVAVTRASPTWMRKWRTFLVLGMRITGSYRMSEADLKIRTTYTIFRTVQEFYKSLVLSDQSEVSESDCDEIEDIPEDTGNSVETASQTCS